MTGDAAGENARVRECLLAQGVRYAWLDLWPRGAEIGAVKQAPGYPGSEETP